MSLRRLICAWLVLLPALAFAQGKAQPRPQPPPAPSIEELKRRLAALADWGYPQRVAALRAFARVKTRACVEFLTALREADADEPIRREALRVIGQVGVDPAASVLSRVLSEGSKVDRPIALAGLGLIRPRVDPAPFLEALPGSQDLSLRLQAVQALGGYSGAKVADALARLLVDDPLVPTLRVPTLRVPTLRVPTLRALAAVLSREGSARWLREEALARRGPYTAALPALLHLAGGAPAKSDALREAITRHLRCSASEVRAAAADALGQRLAGKAGLAEHSLDLLRPLLRDPDPNVVLSAGVAISAIGPVGETLETVLSLCRSKSAGLRAVAIGALLRARHPPGRAGRRQGPR